jgi:hypothetical protein
MLSKPFIFTTGFNDKHNFEFEGFEIFALVVMKSFVLWDIMTCSPLKVRQCSPKQWKIFVYLTYVLKCFNIENII